MPEEILKITKKESYPEFTVEAESLSDLEDNEEREVLALIRKKPDGQFCLVEIEGYPVNGESEEEETEEIEEDEGLPEDLAFDEAVMTRARGMI